MRILALIPARGGSKRLPGKNIRPLGGKPLISWSIDVAKDSADICDILVSTDDPAIAEVSCAAGALVPWLRPTELASDTASSVDVALHALDWYEEQRGAVDGLLLLQPTSPSRKSSSLLNAMELFREHGMRPIVGVAHAQSHPMWCLKIENSHLFPYVEGVGLHLRSQDLPPAYVVTGGLYLISPSDLRETRTFFTPDAVPLITDDLCESIDIDNSSDWLMAEAILSKKPELAV